MKHILRAISMAAVMASVTVFAQGRGSMGGMGANMAKFFGDNKAFSAKMETTVDSAQQSGKVTMEMEMSMLDGKTRVEMDLTKMKGAGMPANRVAQMKQMGMDKTINIIRPDLKASYSVFPNMTAYAVTTMTDKQVSDAMDDSKIEKVSLGKETIDGHACEKNKVTVTGDNGEKHVVTVWNATDMKNFPIQMQMNDNGSSILMKYTDVKLEKPDAKLFDAPSGYTKYGSMQAMMQGEMAKRAGGAGGFAPPPK